MEEYITVKAYMTRFNIGYETVMNMIKTGQLDYKQTPAGKYRIKIGGDTVPKKMYEEEHNKRIEAETTIKLLQNILLERRNKP